MGKLTLHPTSGAAVAFDKDEVSVGRDPGNDFVIPDGSVSRRHAQLLRRGPGWAVVDQGSANGTFLDSHRVADAALRHGQELRFGAVGFRVELEAGSAEPGAGFERAPAATVVQPSPLAPPARASSSPSVPPPPPPPPPAGPRFPTRPAGAPSAAAPPPPRKGKGPLFWIGLGCGGCLTVVALLLALAGGSCYFLMSGPVDAVKAHVDTLGRGDLAAAHAQLSEEQRGRVSPVEFAEFVEQHPALKENAGVRPWPPSGSVNRVNERARVTGVLVSKSRTEHRLVCELVREGGLWKVAALSIEPAR
jgi:hypothetical protein